MAIIVCRECDHRVSDQAASCPSCGAPIAAGIDASQQQQRRIVVAVIGAAALVLIGAVYWFDVRRPSSPSSARSEAFSRTDQSSSLESRGDVPVTPRTVYQTTAERLYQDYAANGVAMQTKIAGSLVRITGRISEIDEDASGSPVVKLAAGNDSNINMTLGTDEVAAAAQLSRGQTVDIQCDRMRRVQGSPEGSRCNLVLVQEAASTPVPVIRAPAPVSPANPVAPASEVHSAATSAPANTGRKSRRSLPQSVIAMVPAIPSESESPAKATPVGAAEMTTVSPIAPAPNGSAMPVAHEPSTPPLRFASIAEATPEREPSVATGTTALTPTADVTSTPTVTPTAAVTPSGAVTATAAAVPVASAMPIASASATPIASAPAVASDDLATVRAADPQAADHIASYCASTSGAGGGAANCRRDEQEAWTRLVQHNEFPALDNATRLKCSQPPFPDSYRAKEICAKYELRIY
jgi:hypothetical protein